MDPDQEVLAPSSRPASAESGIANSFRPFAAFSATKFVSCEKRSRRVDTVETRLLVEEDSPPAVAGHARRHGVQLQVLPVASTIAVVVAAEELARALVAILATAGVDSADRVRPAGIGSSVVLSPPSQSM